jgi:gliding motility-associated-like protein
MKSRLINIILLFFALFLSLTLVAQKTVNSADYAIEQSNTIFDFQTNPKGIYTVSVTSTNVTCYGLCDGKITVTLNGAPTFPVDIRLVLPADLGGGSQNFNNLIITDFPFTISNLCGSVLPYQVRARDASNAIQWSPQVWVVAPGQMIINEVSIVDESCAGSCDGSVKIIDIINAAFPVTYLWSTTSIIDSIGDLCAGTYIVTITDANSCSIDSSFVFAAITPITPVVSNTGPYCVGDLIQLNVDAFSSYVWSGPGAFNSVLQNPTRAGATLAMGGVYSVTVTDAAGCTGVGTTTVVVNALPNAVINPAAVTICEGQNTTFTASGGTSYLWSTGAITAAITVNPIITTIYTVTVTNAAGCTATASITVTVTALVPQTITGTTPLCVGSTAVWTSTTPGGTWTSATPAVATVGLATGLVTGISAGTSIITYSVTIGGCVNTATQTVTINAQTPQTITGNTPLCIGSTDVWTSTTPGGTWTSATPGVATVGLATGLVTGVSAGTSIITYSVNVGGCINTATKTVTITAPIAQTITGTTPICVGSTAIWTSTTPGGTWTSATPGVATVGLATGLVTGISAGTSIITYSVTIGGCVNTTTKTVTITAPIAQTITGNTPLCIGSTDVWTSTTPGGTWTSATPGVATVGLATGLVTGISAGTSIITYSVTIGGCVNTATKTVTIAPLPIATASSNSPVCAGEPLTLTGGPNGMNTYLWSGPPAYSSNLQSPTVSLTANISMAGLYSLTVTDINGCTSTANTNVIINVLTVVETTHTNVTCFGVCDGSIDMTITSGTPGYTYNWVGPVPYTSNSLDISNLCAGTYDLTVTDAATCTATYSVTITEPLDIILSETHTNIAPCFGNSNGTITITASGGPTGIYSYNIGAGPQGSNIFNGLSAGPYTITVTNGLCSKTIGPIVIIQPENINVVSIDIVDELCFGGNTGSIVVHVLGGNPPYVYNIGGLNQNDSTFSGLLAGTYNITITDALNCATTTGIITIAEPVVLSGSISNQVNVLCFGQNTGSVTVIGTGGTPNYTYSLDGAVFVASGIFNGLLAGPHIVTIMDNNGCTVNIPITITEPVAPLTASITTQVNVSCLGGSNGSATVTGSGGTIPYSYDWSPDFFTGDGTDTYSNLIAGIYDVTVTDANLCPTTASITITQPLIAISASITDTTNVNCNGGNTGSATVTAVGGTPLYSYDWSPNAFTGDGTDTYSNLIAGFYTVIVTDFLGCNTSVTIEIQDTSHLQISLVNSTNPTCFGICDGTGTVTALGGLPPYTFTWNTIPGQVGAFANNLCDGTYTVTVEDANLCSRLLNVVITEPLALSFITSTTNPICNSDCNGTATATVSGGTLPYSYLWCNGQITQTATNLCAGNCGVTVTDLNSCVVAPQTVTITSPPILTGTLDITQNVSCNGICNGILTANPSGGVAPYSYAWSPNMIETAQVADSLCALTYFVTITDFNGCSIVVTQTLNQPSTVTADITDSSQVGCHGNCSGTATVLGGGGTGPYTYFWEANFNGYNQITTIADSLCAGTFTVTITDFNLCTAIDSVSIIDTSNLTLSLVSSANPLCNGNCNGDITVIASGGYPNLISPFYTYSWSNNILNNQPFDNTLCSGSYFITVSDDSLCSRILQVDLIDPPLLTDTIEIIPITCTTLCDGSAIAIPSGGTGAYSYLWDVIPSQTNDTINSLCANIMYHVTISDANLCSVIDSVSLVAPPALSANITIVDSISCHSDCNGSVLANVIGGTPSYTYTWNNTLTNDTITGLCAGTYDVTIEDANLCSATATITLGEPDTLQISFTNVTQIACGPGNCTGTATAAVNGGTAPYTYIWGANTGGQTDSTAINLCGDIYSITATDAHGCTIVGTVTITDNSSLSIIISDTNHVTCASACDGSATVTASGATPPYTYLWDDNNNTTNDTVTNLCQGTYYVTVYDANLCSRIDSVVITDAAALIVIDSIIPISCSGLCNASIILIPAGGTPPYITYQWSIAGEIDSIATGLCPGTYYYTVTDFNNCQYNDSVTIIDPGTMQANISIVTPISCHGVCIGSLLTTPSGSLGPYTYLWSDGQTDSLAINLCSAEYHVTVTGQGGCFVIDSINLPEPDTMAITFDNIVLVNCGGDSTGSVTAVVIGGTSPYNYQWGANANNAITAMIDSLKADIYFITVTDANGCSQISNFELQDTSQMAVTVIDSMTISCYGRCDGWATVSASGGTLPYSYIWNTVPLPETTATADTLCAGQYQVTVSDLNLCSRVKLINITQPDSLYISIVDSSSITCASICNGSITVNVFGGTTPYTYNWNNGAIDTLASNLCVGIQQLNISDSHNCLDSLIYNLTSPTALNTTVTPVSALCNNNATDGSITVVITGGSPQYTFLWSNDSTTQNLTGLLAGDYWLTTTDSLGCTKIDSATIGASIIVNATARFDSTICYGDSVQIFGFGGSIYSWSPAIGLTDSTLFNPWAAPLQTTTYYFTVWDSICFDIDSVTIQVHPQIIIDAGTDQTILYEHSATLTATSPDLSLSYLWNPTMWLSDSSSATTTATPLLTTTYYVFATNSNGCVESDSVKVTVIPVIIIPTGITPNGDGSNDIWMIDLIGLYPDCEVEIYNRWGEKLFYSHGYPDSERWDGTFKNKPLPTGTYYFVINLHDEFGTKPITGPITLVR